jgi:large repetitive protein
LKINSRKDIPLSKILGLQSRPTAMEAYTTNDEQVGISLNFKSAVKQGDKALLFQNSPNPFSEETVIAFYLPAAAKATLVVRNVEGKVLFRTQGDFGKGQQQIVLKQSDIKTSGVMNYTLETTNFTETKKMVVVAK